MTEVRNILILGRTGSGKSTLANVLVNKNDNFEEVFKESSSSVSETNEFKDEKFNWNGITYRIVDTIGIGDTKLAKDKVYKDIANAAHAIRGGINQILYVIKGRFDEKEVETLNRLKTYILGSNAIKYTTIVITNFEEFKSESSRNKDLQRLITESNEGIKGFINGCNGVVYVNNPSVSQNTTEGNDSDDEDFLRLKIKQAYKQRNASRVVLLSHLEEKCKGIYEDKVLNEVHERIKDLLAELAAESAAEKRDEKRMKDLEFKIEQEVKTVVRTKCTCNLL